MSFFGGKWRSAHKYPKPIYDTIVEPFAGSAGYSVRYYDRKIVLVEKNAKIFGVWDYLIKAKPEEILALPDIYDKSVDDLNIPQEARWLIGFWCNMGVSKPVKRMSTGLQEEFQNRIKGIKTVGNGWMFWGPKCRERLATQSALIKHWKVLHGSWESIGLPKNKSTWFIDPPYATGEGDHYENGSKDIDYSKLGNWCYSLPGQVIVCEQAGASWLPFKPLGDIKVSPGSHRPRKTSQEVVYEQESV